MSRGTSDRRPAGADRSRYAAVVDPQTANGAPHGRPPRSAHSVRLSRSRLLADDRGGGHLTRLGEAERDREAVTLLQSLLKTHQHDVVSAWRKRHRLGGVDRQRPPRPALPPAG